MGNQPSGETASGIIHLVCSVKRMSHPMMGACMPFGVSDGSARAGAAVPSAAIVIKNRNRQE